MLQTPKNEKKKQSWKFARIFLYMAWVGLANLAKK
jgi:hypothetical protein